MSKPVQRLTVSIIVAIITGLTLFELLTLGPVYAASITVNSTNDTVAFDGFCTLREAIQAANTDAAVNECAAGSGADTIIITATGTILLAIPSTGIVFHPD